MIKAATTVNFLIIVGFVCFKEKCYWNLSDGFLVKIGKPHLKRMTKLINKLSVVFTKFILLHSFLRF